MIPLFKVAMSEKASALVGEVLDSGYIGQGAKVDEFERALAERLDNPRILTVNSATSGLHLALHLVATESGRDGEVLATALTCTATNWPILANGMRIRWVDTDPATLNVDLDDLARKITPATRAIVLVHWGGYPVDLDRLNRVLDQAERVHGVRPRVIEDCADAWGSTYQGVPLGGHGNISVYSFQAIKHLTTGDGGLIVLPDDELLHRARMLRWYGIDRDGGGARFKNDIPEYGFKFNMNDINAAIGLANLETVDGIVARHRENAAFYDGELAGVGGIELTERATDRNPSFWYYSLKVDDRDAFVRRMKEAGIATSEVHERNDVYGATKDCKAVLPGLDSVAGRHIAIPVGWWVSDDDRTHIAQTVKGGW
ncbi:DegT/DnrJ/EryC1/StrS family aminotransferase [Streptomyces sp. NPDC058247]|uniref:DegT/DnrJ/EryC1/StrS family aminotransferase n=1 Tax=Streptomyces sp. NPDC058247 TaxID=3346401 RepID=UPI0036E365FB